MSDRIVYSTLCALAGSTSEQLRPFIEMATMWAAHLRGPGRFGGRIVLLTNLPDVRVEGAESIVAPFAAQDRRQLFLERVRQYRRLPVAPHDQVLQLDLDALTIAPIEAVFDALRPGVLMAARSGYSPLVHEHARNLLTRRERWSGRVRGWDHRAGVSASVTGCDGKAWPRVMRRWAAAIRCRGRGRPVPILGDQSFLNLLFVTGAAPIRRFPRHLVHHLRRPGLPLDDPAATRAVVLHFPFAQKLEEMRRWRRA